MHTLNERKTVSLHLFAHTSFPPFFKPARAWLKEGVPHLELAEHLKERLKLMEMSRLDLPERRKEPAKVGRQPPEEVRSSGG
jgi:hypothetical protein